MPQQENWAIKENPRTTRLPPVEKLCSCSRTSTACVCGKMHVCMFIRIPAHGITSPCMWPPSVKCEGCHSCLSFICRQWEPVIRLGWAASHTALQERPDDFFPSVCERDRGHVSDAEKTSNRWRDPCELAAKLCVTQLNTPSFQSWQRIRKLHDIKSVSSLCAHVCSIFLPLVNEGEALRSAQVCECCINYQLRLCDFT